MVHSLAKDSLVLRLNVNKTCPNIVLNSLQFNTRDEAPSHRPRIMYSFETVKQYVSTQKLSGKKKRFKTCPLSVSRLHFECYSYCLKQCAITSGLRKTWFSFVIVYLTYIRPYRVSAIKSPGQLPICFLCW